jgi:lipoprotein-anchoring transpeptidase ErfK/SrfK
MLFRLFLSTAMVCATFLAMPLLSAGSAKAEMMYNYTEHRWEEVDPMRRVYTRKKPPAKYQRRTVFIRTSERPGTILIDTNEKFLYYILSPNRAIRYGVGVGKEGFEWNGVVKVQAKKEWPTWTPPAEMRARERANGRILPVSMEGGPENPLGARALYLFQGGRDTMYRIHGTNQPWSIGLSLSSGCIRMMNQDVEDLYERTPIGSKVIVVGPNDRKERYLTDISNPIRFIFGG